MNVEMAQVGEELNAEIHIWCDNRRGWVNDRVKECIAERRMENRKYQYTRKTCGVVDVRTKRQEVGMALHVHNEMVMKRICDGGNWWIVCPYENADRQTS